MSLYLKLYIGKYKRLLFTITDLETNAPLDISSDTSFIFTVKRSKDDVDANAILQKTSSNGISITDGVNGKGQIDILPADTTAAPEIGQSLVWDLEMLRGGYPEIVMEGVGILQVPVTRAES